MSPSGVGVRASARGFVQQSPFARPLNGGNMSPPEARSVTNVFVTSCRTSGQFSTVWAYSQSEETDAASRPCDDIHRPS